jgi:hypothetical protein
MSVGEIAALVGARDRQHPGRGVGRGQGGQGRRRGQGRRARARVGEAQRQRIGAVELDPRRALTPGAFHRSSLHGGAGRERVASSTAAARPRDRRPRGPAGFDREASDLGRSAP